MLKKTIIENITITSAGHLEIQLRKLIIDSDIAHDLGIHRTAIECGDDCNLALASINAALPGMGCAKVLGEDWQRVRDVAALAFTPKLVNEHRERKLAQLQALQLEAANAVK